MPFIPGLTSLSRMISTLPALGGERGVSLGYRGIATATNPIRIAAFRIFMGSTAPVVFYCTMDGFVRLFILTVARAVDPEEPRVISALPSDWSFKRYGRILRRNSDVPWA